MIKIQLISDPSIPPELRYVRVAVTLDSGTAHVDVLPGGSCSLCHGKGHIHRVAMGKTTSKPEELCPCVLRRVRRFVRERDRPLLTGASAAAVTPPSRATPLSGALTDAVQRVAKLEAQRAAALADLDGAAQLLRDGVSALANEMRRRNGQVIECEAYAASCARGIAVEIGRLEERIQELSLRRGVLLGMADCARAVAQAQHQPLERQVLEARTQLAKVDKGRELLVARWDKRLKQPRRTLDRLRQRSARSSEPVTQPTDGDRAAAG